MIKRRYQRIAVKDLVASLSDGVNSISGTVSDVSRSGLLLTDMPPELSRQGEKLSITVSGRDKEFKMMVVPKWMVGEQSVSRMGLVILEPPLDWTVFVMNYEPDSEDMWAATTNLPDY